MYTFIDYYNTAADIPGDAIAKPQLMNFGEQNVMRKLNEMTRIEDKTTGTGVKHSMVDEDLFAKQRLKGHREETSEKEPSQNESIEDGGETLKSSKEGKPVEMKSQIEQKENPFIISPDVFEVTAQSGFTTQSETNSKMTETSESPTTTSSNKLRPVEYISHIIAEFDLKRQIQVPARLQTIIWIIIAAIFSSFSIHLENYWIIIKVEVTVCKKISLILGLESVPKCENRPSACRLSRKVIIGKKQIFQIKDIFSAVPVCLNMICRKDSLKGFKNISTYGSNMLGKALEKVSKFAFTRKRVSFYAFLKIAINGDRGDAENILIIVTDGESDDKVQQPVE
uniref:VWFA domain-containing protein n=1 Tax=Heterorhabditis bacteriophora TaxID=37862 RepID=A0A1I7WFN5_HETBA